MIPQTRSVSWYIGIVRGSAQGAGANHAINPGIIATAWLLYHTYRHLSPKNPTPQNSNSGATWTSSVTGFRECIFRFYTEPASPLPSPGGHMRAAKGALLANALARQRPWLPPGDGRALLRCPLRLHNRLI